MKLVIIVGDPKQLNATVKTADQNKRDEVVNPFASQLQLSMFERLQNLGFPVSLFIENFRVTEGLEQLSNGLFYDNKITNADCTKLAVRPKSQEAIKFIKEEYNVVTQVPHVCLHVPKGATQTTKWMSRYNLHNIVVAVNAVKRILAKDLFKQFEIFTIVPYRAQAERYREFLRRLKIYEIEVLTVDASQGRQNRCVIFDLVTSNFRGDLGLGFAVKPGRINVASTRAREMQIVVCDLNVLTESVKSLRYLDKKTEDEQVELKRKRENTTLYLRRFLAYYQTHSVTYTVEPALLAELRTLDMKEATEYLKTLQLEAYRRVWEDSRNRVDNS